MDENLWGRHKTFPCLFCFIYLDFLQLKNSGGIGLARLKWSKNMIALKVEGGVEEVLKS